MPNHQKPTKEELQAQEQAALEEAERLKDLPPEDEEEEPIKEEEKEEEVQEEEEIEEEKEEEKEEEEAEPSKELYKKKFSASSRENQKINAKNRVINQALVEADDLPEPTEDDLVQEYSDWDVMTDTEKRLAKEALITKNWRQVISKAKDQATKIEKWNESVEEFVDDPKTLLNNPQLEGKTDEFKTFATEEENNNVPFKLLVSAFLHDQSTKKVTHKGKMFERGSGGPNDKPEPRSQKISLEESRKLRETDYDLWKEKNAKGLIDYNL